MLARLRKNLHDDEGFTLIELLVVIIIIGILAAIAIPVFLNQRTKGWESAVKSDLRNAATAQETYIADNSAYAGKAGLSSSAGFKGTPDVTIDDVKLAAATTGGANTAGYCIIAHNVRGGKFFVYDSLNGGLQSTTYATSAAATCSTQTPAFASVA